MEMIKEFDKNLIEQYIKEGWLVRQWHPVLDLQILNYSKKTEYTGYWNEITMACRGLVLDKNYKLVSPCMPKFFNFYQHSAAEQERISNSMRNESILVQDKWDGCIGSIFEYNGELVCASKGSFNSFVTEEMYKMIKGKLFVNDFEDCSSNLIVEVIHPNTHILCDYGDTQEFRVITSFRCDRENNDYFEWSYEETLNIIHNMDPKQCLLKPIDSHNLSFNQLLYWQKQHNDNLTEGFVVRLKNNFRVKFKSEEYLECAKAANHISYKTFVQHMIYAYDEYQNIDNAFESLRQHISHLPDELQPEAREIMKKIDVDYSGTMSWIKWEYELCENMTDKELGLCQDEDIVSIKGYIFDLRHNKDIRKKVLQSLLKTDKEEG